MNNYNLEQDVFNWLEAAGFERGDASMQETAISLFFEELKEYALGIFKKDKSEQIDGIVDCQWALKNCLYFGVKEGQMDVYVELFSITDNSCWIAWEDRHDVERYKKAVSISNWSKFCKSEFEAMQTVQAYKYAEHPDKVGKTIQATYKQVGDIWVVYHEHSRKVLKSINYITVQDALKTM